MLFLLACHRPEAATPEAGPTRAEDAGAQAGWPDTVALARDIPRIIAAADIPGLSIAVVQHGRIAWARGFGTVNDPRRSPIDTATIFEAASLSKPVFAYLVLRLAGRGELDLDRPLHQLLEYPRLAHDDRYRRITARMVLSHGTGLPNWGGERLELLFDPGTAYGYSGEGYAFLQHAVERATGRSLEQLARREVFEPLGMTRSSFIFEERFTTNAAYATDWLWRVAPVHQYAEANAAYTLLTTAPDYARFVAAVLTGRGLTSAMWQAYLSPVRETAPGIAIGLGLRLEDTPEGRVFYHSGNNGRRFTCYMTGRMASGMGFVYFTSASNGTSLASALTARVFGPAGAGRHLADYDRYDDPHLAGLRSVRRSAVFGGADSARTRLAAIAVDPATRPTLDEMLELGAFFAGRGLDSLAIEVLTRVEAGAPDSARVHLALGRAHESAGRLEPAIASYRRALALGADSAEVRGQVRWVEERVTARHRPAIVPATTLARYAGRYGDRVVTMRAGRLYYRRDAGPDSALLPLARTLFEVESDPAVRVRFDGDEGGAATKLLEISSDGSVEEAARSQ